MDLTLKNRRTGWSFSVSTIVAAGEYNVASGLRLVSLIRTTFGTDGLGGTNEA